MHDTPFIQAVANRQRPKALLLGAALGFLGGVVGLLIVVIGPTMTTGLLLGAVLAVYAISDLNGALYVTLAVIALVPFGNLPVDVGLTPTLLDAGLGAFLVVYAAQWMTGERRLFRSTLMTPLVIGFILLMLFAFIMGLRHAPMTPRVLRAVAEMVLSLLLIPVLIDIMRTPQHLRRTVLALAIAGTVAAAIGVILWLLPDLTAESILNRLGRLGYPVGGVIRYRETPGALLNERAIGTWIDPNAFGGFLLIIGALLAPQVFSARPIVDRRVVIGMLLVVVAALFLTDSRGAMLSFGVALVFIAALRYRKLLLIMILAGVLALFLPFTQRYIEKFEAGITGQDVETQMRLGEYQDALRLVGRYPIIGVGFSGTPEIDLYLGVANTYLTVASHAGILGLLGYLSLFAGALGFSATRYHTVTRHPLLADVWLGLAAALVGILAGGMFDHYYFKIDQFHATMTVEWMVMGLTVAAVRLATTETPPLPDSPLDEARQGAVG